MSGSPAEKTYRFERNGEPVSQTRSLLRCAQRGRRTDAGSFGTAAQSPGQEETETITDCRARAPARELRGVKPMSEETNKTIQKDGTDATAAAAPAGEKTVTGQQREELTGQR